MDHFVAVAQQGFGRYLECADELQHLLCARGFPSLGHPMGEKMLCHFKDSLNKALVLLERAQADAIMQVSLAPFSFEQVPASDLLLKRYLQRQLWRFM